MRRLAGLGEEGADLVVGGLAKVLVEEADGSEGLGGMDAENLVAFAPEIVASGRCGDRDGDDDLTRDGSKSADGGAHGGSGGKAVVDEDDGFAFDGARRLAGAVLLLAALEFKTLALDGLVDCGGGDVELVNDVVIEDAGSVTSERAHGEFFVAGSPEFADEKDVEGKVEFAGDLIGYGDTATWEREEERVGLATEVRELVG